MDIRYHCASSLGHSYCGPIGQIGAHALCCPQSGPLPQQHTGHLGIQSLRDMVHRRHPAKPDKKRCAYCQASGFQTLHQHRQDISQICLYSSRGQAVACINLHIRALSASPFDLFQRLEGKLAPQIRSGQKLILACAAGLHRKESQTFQ